MASPTIAITGASGFLGTTLVRYFADKGWHVVGLVMDPEQRPALTNIEYRRYELNQPLSKNALRGVDYLVHAAYSKEGSAQDILDTNVAGARRLFEAAHAAGVQKIIFISSMSSHAAAVSAYGRQKFTVEQLLDPAKDIAIRPGLILGQGGIVQSMVGFMRRVHVVPLVGGGKQPIQVVRREEIAQAIDSCIGRRLHGVFTVASTTVYTYKQFYKTLANSIRTPVLFIPLPFPFLLAATRLIGFLHLPIGVSADSVLGLKKLISVDTKADLQKLHLEVADLATSLRQVFAESDAASHPSVK
ncbi:MAG TPA: NAD-dependent epimerase/dehydratase family protein [Candidatus Saccharimonadales bacterium]|nr:NAD-dependent epimerase/dehydratase family protein [Candidatus Saccharimonadales bacterium]